jgi:divalent metal cation (Fe/Co/Zn/Cd) transporter
MAHGAEGIRATTPDVGAVSEVRARWMGHRLLAQVRLGVDGTLSILRAHDIAEDAQHRLLREVTNLSDAIIHLDPEGTGGDPHVATRHHADGQRSGVA